MWDFLSFETFITPKIIRIVFALGLLLIGIHNAWDTVTHIVVSPSRGDEAKTDDRRAHRRSGS